MYFFFSILLFVVSFNKFWKKIKFEYLRVKIKDINIFIFFYVWGLLSFLLCLINVDWIDFNIKKYCYWILRDIIWVEYDVFIYLYILILERECWILEDLN